MKIKISNSDLARKLLFVHQVFGRPSSPARQWISFAPLISEQFYLASQAKELLNRHTKLEQDKIFLAFAEEKINTKKLDISKLAEMLEKIHLPKLPAKYYLDMEEHLNFFKKQVKKRNQLVKKIFGKEFAKETIVVPYEEYKQSVHSGTLVSANPCIIGMGGYFQKSEYFAEVFTHELLHQVIEETIKNTTFEEALLDYFAPNGIIYEILNGKKQFNCKAHSQVASKYRPYAKEYSEKLIPVMQKYIPLIGKITIWQHLKKEGLAEYLK